MKTALIIGGGFAGCTMAHQLALKKGWDILLIESAPFLGAGVVTRFYGGHPYTFGPRHFLTQNVQVFEFLNKFLPLRRCQEHQFVTYIEQDNAFYNFPIHKDDIELMPDKKQINEELSKLPDAKNAQNLEEYWISSVGKVLYNKFINSYSKKMWKVSDNTQIDTFNWSPKGVALKEGQRAAWDTAISAYPFAHDGYNSYFKIATEQVKVLLNTKIEKYNIEKKSIFINGEWKKFDVVINTISPDQLFDCCFGDLPFVGRDFHKIVFPQETLFPNDIYFLYYANDEKFTRLVEYKKFTQHKSPTTLIGMEIPSENGKHYPMPIKKYINLANRYIDLMPKDVFSIGRAGSYQYHVDIDDCIEQAMAVCKKLGDS